MGMNKRTLMQQIRGLNTDGSSSWSQNVARNHRAASPFVVESVAFRFDSGGRNNLCVSARVAWGLSMG
jgi:hypothetical protein